jgi:hypothetical protein
MEHPVETDGFKENIFKAVPFLELENEALPCSFNYLAE